MIEIKEGFYSVYLEYFSDDMLDYGVLVTDLQGKVVANSIGRNTSFVIKGPTQLRVSCMWRGDYTNLEEVVGHQIVVKEVNYE